MFLGPDSKSTAEKTAGVSEILSTGLVVATVFSAPQIIGSTADEKVCCDVFLFYFILF
jgi:hypothetical protein